MGKPANAYPLKKKRRPTSGPKKKNISSSFGIRITSGQPTLYPAKELLSLLLFL
jgi:hypothetical protein